MSAENPPRPAPESQPEEHIEWEDVKAPEEVTPSIESLAIGHAHREFEAAELRSQSESQVTDLQAPETENVSKSYQGEPNYSVPAVWESKDLVKATDPEESSTEHAEHLDWQKVHAPHETFNGFDLHDDAAGLEEVRSRLEKHKEPTESQESNESNVSKEKIKSSPFEQSKQSANTHSAKKSVKKGSSRLGNTVKTTAWGVGTLAGIGAAASAGYFGISALTLNTPVLSTAAASWGVSGTGLGLFGLVSFGFGIYAARQFIKGLPDLRKEIMGAVKTIATGKKSSGGGGGSASAAKPKAAAGHGDSHGGGH